MSTTITRMLCLYYVDQGSRSGLLRDGDHKTPVNVFVHRFFRSLQVARHQSMVPTFPHRHKIGYNPPHINQEGPTNAHRVEALKNQGEHAGLPTQQKERILHSAQLVAVRHLACVEVTGHTTHEKRHYLLGLNPPAGASWTRHRGAERMLPPIKSKTNMYTRFAVSLFSRAG